MKLDDIRQGFDSLREGITEGWERLRQRAGTALTRFRPGHAPGAGRDLDDESPGQGVLWAMLGGDIFEDARRVLVRLEAPGMEKKDFQIEVHDDTLLVRGEKRFERESSGGHWRIVQCAYGSFQRAVPLPSAVRAEDARATYRNGVLRVELPKRTPGAASARVVPVH